MDNFEKSDIISDVAYDKNKSKFLPKNEQMRLNNEMKQKLVRFASEISSEPQRPHAMQLFDEMMNGMHGNRVKNLYAYRRQGNHIMALICNSLPPELVYAMGNFIPVSVCMGAGEVEIYADEYSKDMCSISRSMLGFLKSGMCVFFNLADYILSSDLCPSLKKTLDIITEMSDEFNVFCINTHKDSNDRLDVDMDALAGWVDSINKGKGLQEEKLLEYAALFSEIRKTYQSIFNLRKSPNPPINGKNSLWIQQLALVEEPHKLLDGLKILEKELVGRVSDHVGYDSHGTKKRVMLISPRIMPPFGEIYRLIENTRALIVCEEMDMGITNIDYDFEKMQRIVKTEGVLPAAKYMLESVDVNSSSCVESFDIEKIKDKIEGFGVDAVIGFSFRNCEGMYKKTNAIKEVLTKEGVPALVLEGDYLEMYEKPETYMSIIKDFLNP